MRIGGFRGALLSALVIASLIAPVITTISVLPVGQVSASPGPDAYENIVRGFETAYNINGDAPAPWKRYGPDGPEKRPPIMATQRVDNGAVVAAGFVASCRNEGWNNAANNLPYLDVLLDNAFQWMVPGATNVLWYGEIDIDYNVYNDAQTCSQLVNALVGKGYTVDDTINTTFDNITSDLLAPYDILVIPQMELGDIGTGGDPTLLPDSVVATIENFVRTGGGLLILEGYDSFGYNYARVQNKILRALDMGMYFQSDTVQDNTNNWGSAPWQPYVNVDNTTWIGSAYETATGGTTIGVYANSSLAEIGKPPTVGVSIEPQYRGGLPGDTLEYVVSVINLGWSIDNYTLSVSDTTGWDPALSGNLLENVLPTEVENVTLSVTIPENAEPSTEDSIVVTATSIADNTMSASDNCIARATSWAGTAVFSLVNLYTVNVEKILDLNQGSRLVVKFYRYDNVYLENENVIESFVPPAHVEESESARHPEDICVKKARLDLTTDNTENVISTIASFTVRKVDLEDRFMWIPFYWVIATSAGKLVLETEFMRIPFCWSGAPS